MILSHMLDYRSPFSNLHHPGLSNLDPHTCCHSLMSSLNGLGKLSIYKAPSFSGTIDGQCKVLYISPSSEDWDAQLDSKLLRDSLQRDIYTQQWRTSLSSHKSVKQSCSVLERDWPYQAGWYHSQGDEEWGELKPLFLCIKHRLFFT